MDTPIKKPFYKTWWGIILTILLFPIIVPYIAWTRTQWNLWAKISITLACVIILIIGATTNKTPNSLQESTKNQPPSNPINTSKEINAVKLIFDISSLVGKDIDEIRNQLGKPTDGNQMEPTKQQQKIGLDMWYNSFKVTGNDRELLVTFNPKTRKVIDFFLPTGEKDMLGTNKDILLQEGNLSKDASNYSIEFVKSLQTPSSFTGVKVTPR